MNIQDKLDSLKSEIMRLEPYTEMGILSEELKVAAEENHTNPAEYRRKAGEDYIAMQREYNRLVDESPELSGNEKFIIDTFGMGGKYRKLEQVEINLNKRLKEDKGPGIRFCRLLTENEEYRFYSVWTDFLREDKRTGEVVYFGHSASAACIYEGKLYWGQDVGIGDECYLFRCNIEDGSDIERFDIVSNARTPEVMGFDVHTVCEDRITDLCVEGDYIKVTVARVSENYRKYQITISDIDGDCKMTRCYLTKQIDKPRFILSRFNPESEQIIR